jgi:hypothetical protein
MFSAIRKTEEVTDPQLSSKIDQAWKRYEDAMDACHSAPECPKSGGPNCPDSLEELRQARQALRDLGVKV